MDITRRLGLTAMLLVAPSVTAQDTTSPVWASPHDFWFRKTVPGGHEWWHVDALHGVRERLFDHRRLAIELNQRSGGEYTALTLPFAGAASQFMVKYDGSNAFTQEGALAIEFQLNREWWRCDLQGEWDWGRVPPSDYECQSQGPTDAGSTVPIKVVSIDSPDGKWAALVDSHNVAIRPIASGPLRVLSTDGSATNAYQLGSIRWSPDSRTVTAYRVDSDVWSAAAVAGDVKQQIKKGEWAVRPISIDR